MCFDSRVRANDTERINSRGREERVELSVTAGKRKARKRGAEAG